MQSKVWDALFSMSAQNRVSTHSSLAMGWYVPANFFWDKCEGFLYDCQVSKNNLKISDNFPNTSGRCSKFFRRCSNFLSTFPIWSSCLVPTIKMQSESNSFSVFWYTWDTQSTLYMPFWNILKIWNWIFLLIMCSRTKSSGCVSQKYM